MQMQNIGVESKSLFSEVEKKAKFNPWSCAVNIWRQEGVVGLCRGLGSTFFREVPSFGVYFGAYDTFCKMELKEGQRIDEVIRRAKQIQYTLVSMKFQTWGQALSKGLKSKPKALSEGLKPKPFF